MLRSEDIRRIGASIEKVAPIWVNRIDKDKFQLIRNEREVIGEFKTFQEATDACRDMMRELRGEEIIQEMLCVLTGVKNGR